MERRRRVLAYPRLYRLHALIRLPAGEAAAAERPLPMWHLQTLRSQPASKHFALPFIPQALPLAAPRQAAEAAPARLWAVPRDADDGPPLQGTGASDGTPPDVPLPDGPPVKVSGPVSTCISSFQII